MVSGIKWPKGGDQSRIALGTAVVGGMLTATILAIFYVPMFFVVVSRQFADKGRKAETGGKVA
nr:efflux RND transporter permease subunit [Rhizomicrobium palustre]